MSKYNDTLSNTVISILQHQEQEVKKTKAQLAAATFTLYYAQSAAINSWEQLQAIQKNIIEKKLASQETKQVANQSTNVLQSTNNANTYVKQCLANAAVSAANIQIAANAILKLDSDVATVLNIINAADFGTEIYKEINELSPLMNTTAYHAELASQMGMETSILISQVTTSALNEIAKNADIAVHSLLKDVSDNYTNAMQLVAQDNEACISAFATEKMAAGTYENANVQYKAATAIYHSQNNEMNLGLMAYAIKDSEANNFGVTFNTIKPVFLQETKYQYYPVKDYYLFVVKENRKPFFTIEAAQEILINEPKQFIPLSNFLTQKNVPPTGKKIVVDFNSTKIMATDGKTFMLEDTDGDSIKQGINYVVFLVAIFFDDYKKRINNYDDFLSAPSCTFCLTQTLSAVASTAIIVEKNNDDNCSITFTVAEHPNYDVVYRCMFLPDMDENIKGLLNNSSASDMDTEVNELTTIATQYDPKIARFEAVLIETEMLIDELKKLQPISDEDAIKLKEQLHHAEILQQQLNKLIARKVMLSN